MMNDMVIYKFRLHSIPVDGQICHIGIDPKNSVICAWVIVSSDFNSDAYYRVRNMRIIPTGQKFDKTNLRFHGTIVENHGFVWHIFEERQ